MLIFYLIKKIIKEIRSLILDGKINRVKEFLVETFPNILKNNEYLELVLNSQIFIEKIKEKDLNGAIEFASKYLSNFLEKTILVYGENGKLTEFTIEVKFIKIFLLKKKRLL